MTCDELLIANNTGSTSAGGFYFGESHKNILLHNVVFRDNHGDISGALFFSRFNTEIIISDSTFVSNTAVTGGGIVSVAVSIQLLSCVFMGNSALQNFGGVYLESQRFVVTDSIFSFNFAFKVIS